jgi:hypothetical protein
MATVATAAGDDTKAAQAFISGKSACDIVPCSYPRLRQLARDGRIRVRQLPGGYPRYCLSDVLRVAEEAGQPSGCETEGVATC